MGLCNHWSDDVMQDSGVQLSGSHRLDVFGLTSESFPALVSSLMHSHDTHELTIRNSMVSLSTESSLSVLKWCWLFYALFNEASSHSITSLRIEDEDILLTDLLMVSDMVQLPRPLKMLKNPEYDRLSEASSSLLPSLASQPVHVTLRADAQVQIDPYKNLDGLIQTCRTSQFDVVDDVGDEFDVIVPRYGESWVNREDVVSSVPFSDNIRRGQWRFQTHSIKKVSISLNKALVGDKERGIRELLKLIGAPITHLSLSIPTDKAFDNS